MKMSSKTKCVFYAYPSSTFGGENGGWIASIYKNVLATDPLEYFFFDDMQKAKEFADQKWSNLPWDKYRSV